MSRAALARFLLGVAVAVCASAAVVVLMSAHGPAVAPAPVPEVAAALSGPAPVPAGERVVVQTVVDAVTFDARLPDGGPIVRVRALGVQPPGACYGAQATAFAAQVLDGRAVILGAGAGPATDRFDRRLAAVALVGGADYAVLASEAGIARAYSADAQPAAMPAVRAAQDRARLAERGVWGEPCRGEARPSPAGSGSSADRTAESATSPGS